MKVHNSILLQINAEHLKSWILFVIATPQKNLFSHTLGPYCGPIIISLFHIMRYIHLKEIALEGEEQWRQMKKNKKPK